VSLEKFIGQKLVRTIDLYEKDKEFLILTFEDGKGHRSNLKIHKAYNANLGWLERGTKIVCKEPFSVDLRPGEKFVLVGDKATIHNVDDSRVFVNGFYSDPDKDFILHQPRDMFLRFWGPLAMNHL
jgi:hypothetical protein